MRKILACLLSVCVLGKNAFQEEVEHAFIRFDVNNDGLVTREQIMNAVAEDVEDNKSMESMITVIDKMISKYDVNGDGLDFGELYRASGGNSEEL